MKIITTRSLTKVYQTDLVQLRAINNINLQIEAGDFVAITGPSGSGKTTLLNILGGLIQPTNGVVHIKGNDITNMNDEELAIFRRKHIGFVFQNYNLIPVINVYENISFPLELENQTVDHDYIVEIVRMLGIEDKLYQMPASLSGGQQQRVAIARALVTRPAVILADEPTGNLDSRSSDRVIDIFQEMVKKWQHTLIMVTHNDKIAQKADRIVEIVDGNVSI